MEIQIKTIWEVPNFEGVEFPGSIVGSSDVGNGDLEAEAIGRSGDGCSVRCSDSWVDLVPCCGEDASEWFLEW